MGLILIMLGKRYHALPARHQWVPDRMRIDNVCLVCFSSPLQEHNVQEVTFVD